jgi:translation initiation factor 4A
MSAAGTGGAPAASATDGEAAGSTPCRTSIAFESHALIVSRSPISLVVILCFIPEDAQLECPSSNAVGTNWESAAPVHSFDDMHLKEDLLRGIYAYGLEMPSALQQRSILPMTSGRDTIVEALSGTGKTAAVAIGVLQLIDEKVVQCQALLLAPAREIALLIARTIVALGEFLDIKAHACIGGASVREDVSALDDGVHVVVGTPGRIFDMINRQALRLELLKLFVLDEADEIWSLGFEEQIHGILQRVPQTTQVCLVSATMPHELSRLAQLVLREPVHIIGERGDREINSRAQQFFIHVEKEEWKLEALLDMFESLTSGIPLVAIYANTRTKVEWLTSQLQERGLTVFSVHGDVAVGERDVTMREFRSGASHVLVTTDLLLAGHDALRVPLIVNFDLPTRKERYIHRVGRASRFGRQVVVINVVTSDDASALQEIREYYSTQIDEMPLDIASLL